MLKDVTKNICPVKYEKRRPLRVAHLFQTDVGVKLYYSVEIFGNTPNLNDYIKIPLNNIISGIAETLLKNE